MYFLLHQTRRRLAQIKDPAFGVYGERRFLLAETNMFSAVVAMPTEQGNFGFQADYFGYKNYNESQLGLLMQKPRKQTGSRNKIQLLFFEFPVIKVLPL